MEILWLLFGLVVGLLVAWFFLAARYRMQLADREAEFSRETRRLNQVLQSEWDEHETTKQRLSDADAQAASAAERARSLEAELTASRQNLERVEASTLEDNAKMDQMQSVNQALKARLRTAESARAELDGEFEKARASARAAREERQTRIAGLEAQAREGNEKIANLEAQLAALSGKTERPVGVAASESTVETIPRYAAAPAASDPADDLTRIKGIGPVLKDKLVGLGITSFQQIAEFTPADIDRVTEVLDFPGRIERERWVEQAREIMDR